MYTICIGVYIRIQHYQHYQLIMLDIYIYIYIYIYISTIISSHNKNLMKNNAPNTKPYKLQIHCFNTSKPRQYIQEQQKGTSRSVITTIRNPTIYKSHKSSQVYMGNKGKTPRKFVFQMVNSRKALRILRHYEKVSFMSPRKTGNC